MNKLLLIWLVVCTACGTTKPNYKQFIGKWAVISLYQVDVQQSKAVVEMRGKDHIIGFGGCNTFAGKYEANVEKKAIQFGGLMSTKMYCEGAGNKCEQDLFKALQSCESYESFNEGIFLLDSYNQKLAYLRKVK